MIPFLKTEGSVTLHYNGKTATIAKGDGRFDAIVLAIRENRTSDVIELADNDLYFTKQGLKVQDGVLQIEGEDMPAELSARIMGYKEENLPITSLLAFWANLKQNPSFNSRAMLFKFLENKGHSITEDGHFCGYRGVTEDLKDRHTGKFDNSPGSVCIVPRESVDDNPDNTCSTGLHVGGYEYAKDFARGGKLVLVKVNPKDVVAVPNDYNGQKMRVCRFEVLKEATDILAKNVVSADGGDYDEELATFEFDMDQDDSFDDLRSESARDADEETGISRLVKRLDAKHNLLSPKRKKSSYKNNYAKRGPDGKFIAKKKTARKAK
jgi:hypothetical protein